MITLIKDAVTLYDIEINEVWCCMSTADGERDIRLCRELGDTVQEYETVDRDGNLVRVVLQTDAPSRSRKPDQGAVYVFT
ncbi:hypothetical protein [Streptomyces sp. WAC 01529]|uniref:hypothetical protein n=1 Tax=Streptomyces sp. WAC 01529 TaxID=2203205 RepID=UPI000F7488C9|nr:hypothetical protein [Streptomyces sp. WAC 01529]